VVEFLYQLKHFLFTPEGLQELIHMGGYWVLVAIVFAETGLLVGFFLPGDSLLFIAGFVAGLGHLEFLKLNLLLMAAAIIGDTVGYWIGAKAGAGLYDRPDSRFFKRHHLLKTKAFYDKHGGKTIILARFVPIIRTFAPVVAGIAKMDYTRFISFNVFGGIGWVLSMTSLGYFLGSFPIVQRNLEKAVLIVVFISVLPIVIEYFGHRAEAKAKVDDPRAKDKPEA
jgi:membrane-associated protein